MNPYDRLFDPRGHGDWDPDPPQPWRMDVDARPFPKLYEEEPGDVYAAITARESRRQTIHAEAEQRRTRAQRLDAIRLKRLAEERDRAMQQAERQAQIRRETRRREREYQAEMQRTLERTVRRLNHIAEYGWIEDDIYLRWPLGGATKFVGVVRWSGKPTETPWKGRQVT
jgi:hypothetical protein